MKTAAERVGEYWCFLFYFSWGGGMGLDEERERAGE